MKKYITSALIGLVALLMAAAPAFADGGTTITETTTHRYCYTNAYGQETCTDDKQEVEKYEKVLIKEPATTSAIVVEEHQVLDAALGTSETAALMVLMGLAFVAVTYKLKTSLKSV